MFLIWGSKYRKTTERTLRHNCIICESSFLNLCSYRKWFSFFFIPIFPYSRKDYYVECLDCQNIYKFNGLEKIVEDKDQKFDW